MTGMSNFEERAAKPVDPNKVIRKARIAEYPKQTMYFVASIIAVACILHVSASISNFLAIRRARNKSRARPVTRGEKEAQSAEGGRSTQALSLRRIPLAILNFSRVVAFRVSVPTGSLSRLTLIEVILPVLYLVALLIWEFINCRNITTGAMLDINYWNNRAGTLCIAQIPFMLVLANKNNVITIVTGVSYEKLNVLHRASARVILLMAWIHTGGRLKAGLTNDKQLIYGYVRGGVVALTSFTLLTFLGSRRLRNRGYDLFLATHILLSVVFLVGLIIHVQHFPDFFDYAWPTVLLWGFDRILRLVRVIYIKYSTRKHPSGDALLEVLSPDALRVTVSLPASSALSWHAGQNAYLTVPCVSRFPLEAHPFTIASIDSSLKSDVGPAQDDKLLRFIIRARKGFTRRLHEYAEKVGADAECRVSAYIDGPYGVQSDCLAYPNVVLVAGGSGVSYTLPLLLDIVRRSRNASTLCNKLLFVWVVRNREHIEWVSNELLSALEAKNSSLDVDIRIFVSGEATRGSVPSLEKEEDSLADDSPSGSKEKLDSPVSFVGSELMSIATGRPNLEDLLFDWISLQSSSVSVNVSGPQPLINHVRDTLRSPRISGPLAILRGRASIKLNVETFGIA